MLQVLQHLGFATTSDEAKNEVLQELNGYTNSDLKTFEHLLCAMGAEQYDPKNLQKIQNFSNDVFHFDFEAIEGPGAYIRILNNCARLSKGYLDLTEVKDTVDVADSMASVNFMNDGKRENWDLKVNDDWADPQVFVKLNDILDRRKSTSWFYKHDLAQDCLIAFLSRKKSREINSKTGLNFWEFRN